MANKTMLLNSGQTNEVVGPSIQGRQINSYWVRTAKQLTAGALSGCVEVCITYPTEYVKVMLQLDDRSGQKKRFTNSFDVVRQTIRNHGVFGTYRGFSVVLYGAFPKNMIRFGAFEQIKQFYTDEKGQLKPREKLICGLGAGITEGIFVVIPQESIKVKFINDRVSEKPRFRGLFHGVREIIREKGIRGTYQGVMPTLLKQGSNQAIRFFVFESLKEWHEARQGAIGSVNNVLLMPIFGAIAGAVSVFGNTPIDVVKTRMQGLEAHRYTSTWHCVTQIYRHEGLLAFYKGTMPRLTKVSMEVAIAFTMYNAFLDLFFNSTDRPNSKH